MEKLIKWNKMSRENNSKYMVHTPISILKKSQSQAELFVHITRFLKKMFSIISSLWRVIVVKKLGSCHVTVKRWHKLVLYSMVGQTRDGFRTFVLWLLLICVSSYNFYEKLVCEVLGFLKHYTALQMFFLYNGCKKNWVHVM